MAIAGGSQWGAIEAAVPEAIPSVSGNAAVAKQQITVVEDDLELDWDFRCLATGSAKGAPATTSIDIGYQPSMPSAAYYSIDLTPHALNVVHHRQGLAHLNASVTHFYNAPGPGGAKLVVQWRHGQLGVIYNGRTVVRLNDLGTQLGSLAVSTPAAGTTITLPQYQPVEPVYFADDFMRTAGAPELWSTTAGKWKVNTTGDVTVGANPFTYVGQGSPAIAVVGNWFWNDYAESASVRPAGGGAVGLVAYWLDDNNYLLLQWHDADEAAARGHELQLWQVVDGRASLLAEDKGGYRAHQWYALSLGAANGIVTAGIDGAHLLEAHCDLFGQGKVGLYAQTLGDAQAMFDDVEVQSTTSRTLRSVAKAPVRPPVFAKDDSMVEWASPSGEWLPDETAPTTTFWSRGAFYGDHSFAVTASSVVAGAHLQAVVGAETDKASSGYALDVKTSSDNKTASVQLLRAGIPVSQPVTTKLSVTEPKECALKLERRGDNVLGALDGKLLFSYHDPRPLLGRRALYVAENAKVDFSDAHVSTSHEYDYTFYRAPTDWYVTSGTWDVASRWICTPTWTWYGGWGDRVASVWNKRGFAGDFTVEIFAAAKMDSAGPPYYLHPRDLNVTVAGDGRDLASGYSCIFGGWNNTSTRLLRGTHTVAETDKTLLPMPYHPQAHHRWFRLTVEKTGDTIRYYLDRKLLLQYKDATPLDGHRIALWTCNNGMMIARATIYYEKETGVESVVPAIALPPATPTDQIQQLNWIVRDSDNNVRLEAVTETPAKGAAPGHPAVRATNIEGGGAFSIEPQLTALDALKTPKLSFDCKVSPGTQVNLYLQTQGAQYTVRLTGMGPDVTGTKPLPVAAKVTDDDNWHHVNLDLTSLLKPLYATATTLAIDHLFIGNLTSDPYLQGGFGANGAGSHYLVRNFTLSSPDNRLAMVVEPMMKVAANDNKRVASAETIK